MASLTHWHVLGAGSIGCLWAWYLHKAGHCVTFICKDNDQKEKLTNTLPLTLVKNNNTYTTDIEIINIKDLSNGHYLDNILVCVKAHQTQSAMQTLASAINKNTTIVLMQNGMGNQQEFIAAFPDNPVYTAITTEAACSHSILSVEHTGIGLTQIGFLSSNSLSKNNDNDILKKLNCDLSITLNTDIEKNLWQKLVVNCCINPLTVIYACKNGALANNINAQKSIKKIITECYLLATALNKESYLQGIEKIVCDVIHSTAKNTSSMRQDTLHNRQTEIHYMNGYIVSQAKKLKLDVPENSKLLKAIEGLSHST